MAFSTIGEVLKEFQVFYTEANFILEIAFNVSNYFREDLELVMREGVVDNSEFAICENLIYPVIKEVWKQYLNNFIRLNWWWKLLAPTGKLTMLERLRNMRF
ncbi:hypothetical protein NIES4075_05060 [Tolypothrix sp. NIES-4075]|nr:hypothetical protein NIES4075_05060 [Tolypothrix sp. NIES-4075]